ncbi:MAG: MgtC/SapB family protein [Patescibacteria group bacterium]
MEQFLNNEMFIRLFIAMVLGIALGFERFIAGKPAGIRTYTLISLGSALFVIISQQVTAASGLYNFDPLRVAAQIVAAAGFLGVGAMFHRDNKVIGLTTASGMWVAAGVGVACGFGFYSLAVVVTFLAIFTLVVLWFIEKQIKKFSRQDDPTDYSL